MNTYDRLSDLNLSAIRLAELRYLRGTGRALSKSSEKSRQASYRRGILTPIGDIEATVWYQAIETIIQRDGEQQFFSFLLEWEAGHNYAHLTAKELRQHSLQLYSYRIFDNPKWVDFIPFNRKSRPETLEHAHIVTIINACCKLPGQVTQEQLDDAYGGTVACPHCGKWSAYTIVDRSGPWAPFTEDI